LLQGDIFIIIGRSYNNIRADVKERRMREAEPKARLTLRRLIPRVRDYEFVVKILPVNINDPPSASLRCY